MVKAKVVAVKHPRFDSPSLIGDKSEATLTVARGTIPMHPEVTRIIMGFDKYNSRSSLEVGGTCTLLFTSDGKLFDYDMLGNRLLTR